MRRVAKAILIVRKSDGFQTDFVVPLVAPAYCKFRDCDGKEKTTPLQKTTRLAGLDTLRALAILAVMLFHLQGGLSPSFRPVAQFGWMGVDLFFVLSGYLIGSQLLEAHPHASRAGPWSFYRRRLYRILPAYLVVLALYFLAPPWREQAGISPLWQFLTFTENLFVDYERNQAFSHVWSLCIEEQFYLVLPLVVLTMRRASLPQTSLVIGSLVLAGIVARSWVLFHGLRPLGADDFGVKYIENIYYPTYARMDGLLAGVSLALVRAYRAGWWVWLIARSNVLLAGGVGLAGFSLWLFVDRFDSLSGAAAWGTVVGFPLLSVALAMIVASSLGRSGLLARLRVPGATWIATLAYSLYLTHKALAHLARVHLPGWTGARDWRTLVTEAAVCFAGAAALHYAVERPFLLLRDRLEMRTAQPVEDEIRLDPAL